MVRLHVICEQRVLMEVIAGALAREPGIDVIGQSTDSRGLAPASRPDVVVLCHGWRETERAVAECREKAPAAKIVLLLLGGSTDEAGDAGADYVVDAADGLATLAAVIRTIGR